MEFNLRQPIPHVLTSWQPRSWQRLPYRLGRSNFPPLAEVRKFRAFWNKELCPEGVFQHHPGQPGTVPFTLHWHHLQPLFQPSSDRTGRGEDRAERQGHCVGKVVSRCRRTIHLVFERPEFKFWLWLGSSMALGKKFSLLTSLNFSFFPLL